MLAFFFIIGLSFLLMAGTLMNMLGNYLFDMRIRADRAGLEKWAVQAADSLGSMDARGIDEVVRKAGAELGSRACCCWTAMARSSPTAISRPWAGGALSGGGQHPGLRPDCRLWHSFAQA